MRGAEGSFAGLTANVPEVGMKNKTIITTITKKTGIMRIKMNPKGYLVMDTCCFVNYCKPEDEFNKKDKAAFN